MENKEVLKTYCRQYALFEKDILKLSEYVSIDPINYATFSPRLTSLFIGICSEIDSLAREWCAAIIDEECKQFCESCRLDEEELIQMMSKEKTKVKNGGITSRIDKITEKHKNFRNFSVETVFPLEKITFVPFVKIESGVSSWWTDYNRVKHNRTDLDDESGRYNYTKANLKNVLTALSAFYIMLKTTLSESERNLMSESRIFQDCVMK